MRTQFSRLCLICAVLVPMGWAQEAEIGAADDAPLTPPITLNGQGPSLAFQSEKSRGSYLSGGVSVTGTYTDNALLSSTHELSNFSTLIQPHLSLSQAMSRLSWDFSLGAGLIVNQNLSESNQASENLNFGLAYRLSPHLSLQLNDAFTNTTGLFSGIGDSPLTPGPGALEQPNTSLIVPLAQRTLANSSGVALSYQTGPNSITGVRGSYSLLNFPDAQQQSQFGSLYDTQTYLGEAFYDYRMTAKQWVGVTVRAQKFKTESGFADSDVGSLLLFYAVNPTPTVTVSVFAGPEYLDIPTFAGIGRPRDHLWTSAEGVTVSWEGERTSTSAGFVRQFNDSGGLSSPLTLVSVNGRLRRQLSPHQNIQLGFAYALNDPVEIAPSLQGFSGSFQFERRFGKNLALTAGYTRSQQEVPASRNTVGTNQSWVSLSYDFTRPLGR